MTDMKAVQFTMDEELLRRMDRDPEVKADGRSAVVRRAVTEYLAKRRTRDIADAYRRGYEKAPVRESELGALEGQAWPDE